MPDETKVGCTPATTIAAVNAVICHLGKGIFLSEYDIYDYSVKGSRHGKLVRECSINGRTNTGAWIFTSSSIVFKEGTDGKTFPIEKVIVAVQGEPTTEGSYKHKHTCYECVFGETGITVTNIGDWS